MTSKASCNKGRPTRPLTTLVWDPLIRFFHWSLVGGVAYEMLADAGTSTHEMLGYLLLVLIAVRVVWGFVGTTYARFSNFIVSPLNMVIYAKSILVGHPKRYIGHNPAGAAMVLMLMLAVAVTAATGWAMITDTLWGEAWIEELHKVAANTTITLVAFHVIGVILASVQHRENLLKSMITGHKTL